MKEDDGVSEEASRDGEWIQSAVNHIHWIAQTSDNEEVNEAKLRSFMNHSADIHEGHRESYPECLHDMPLGPDRKKYLTKGTIPLLLQLIFHNYVLAIF